MNLKTIAMGMAMLCLAGTASAQYGYYNRPYGYGDRYRGGNFQQRPQYEERLPNECLTNSILSFAPIQITENGVGMSVSWERNLDRYGYITFNLPAILTFNLAADKYTGYPKNDPMFYIMPGIKVYTNLNTPTFTKFAIGPSLVIGAGRGTVTTSNYGYNTGGEKQGRFLMGAMGNISANLFPAPHLYLGAEYGLGLSYINTYGAENRGPGFLTQLSLKIGYTYLGK